jgi:hypothetical protein
VDRGGSGRCKDRRPRKGTKMIVPSKFVTLLRLASQAQKPGKELS